MTAKRSAAVLASLVIGFMTWLPAPAAAASLDDAVAAYDAGDYDRARAIFAELAASGVAEAQYSLGVMSHAGIGQARDDDQAVRWFRQAAEQDHLNSMFNLGIAYWEGAGVEQDAGEAVRWWRRAAELGLPEAQHNLGTVYYLGKGAPKDYALAIAWFRRAARNGHTEAGAVLAKLSEKYPHLAPQVPASTAAQAKPAAVAEEAAAGEPVAAAGPSSAELEQTAASGPPAASAEVERTTAAAEPPAPAIEVQASVSESPASSGEPEQIATSAPPAAGAELERTAAVEPPAPAIEAPASVSESPASSGEPEQTAASGPPAAGAELERTAAVEPPAPVIEARATASDRPAGGVGTLSLLASPDDASPVIGLVDVAARLQVFKRQGPWLLVGAHRGIDVWVYGRYIEDAGGHGRITADQVRARPLPSTGPESDPVGVFNSGDEVTVLGEQSGWKRVRAVGPFAGWIDGSAVTEADRAGWDWRRLNGSTAADQTAAITARSGEAPVYAFANPRSPVIGRIDSSTELDVLQRQGQWLLVRVPDGVDVWVYGKYVDGDSGHGRVNTNQVRARPYPSTANESTPLGVFRKGDIVEIMSVNGDWKRVRTVNRVAGWVHTPDI